MTRIKMAALTLLLLLLAFVIFSYIKVEILTRLHIDEFPHSKYPGTSTQLEKIFHYKDEYAVLYVVTSNSDGICKEGYYLYFVKEDGKWMLNAQRSPELLWSSCGSADRLTWPLYLR